MLVALQQETSPEIHGTSRTSEEKVKTISETFQVWTAWLEQGLAAGRLQSQYNFNLFYISLFLPILPQYNKDMVKERWLNFFH